MKDVNRIGCAAVFALILGMGLWVLANLLAFGAIPAKAQIEPGWRPVGEGELVWSRTAAGGDTVTVTLTKTDIRMSWQRLGGASSNYVAPLPEGERPVQLDVQGCGNYVTLIAEAPSGTVYQWQWMVAVNLTCLPKN
jgi:hypothetical protein